MGTCSPYLADRAGRVRCGDGRIVVDVTERKESENLFRAVFDGAFEAMVISNDEGRYVDVNPAACEVFGRTHDELVGMRVGTMSGTPEQAGTAWRSLLEEGAVRGPYDVIRPDGSVRETELSREGERPARPAHLGPARRDRAQAARARPLARAAPRERRPPRRRRRARFQQLAHCDSRLRAAAARARRAQEASSITTPRRSTVRPIARPGSPRSCSPSAAASCSRRAPPSSTASSSGSRTCCRSLVGPGVELTFELDPAVCPVRVDPAQIEQVLVSLVTNAADATPAGGRVIVRTANCRRAGGGRPGGRSLRRPLRRGLGARRRRSRRSSISSSRSSRRKTSVRASGSASRPRTGSRSRAAARSPSRPLRAPARRSRSFSPSRSPARGDDRRHRERARGARRAVRGSVRCRLPRDHGFHARRRAAARRAARGPDRPRAHRARRDPRCGSRGVAPAQTGADAPEAVLAGPAARGGQGRARCFSERVRGIPDPGDPRITIRCRPKCPSVRLACPDPERSSHPMDLRLSEDELERRVEERTAELTAALRGARRASAR